MGSKDSPMFAPIVRASGWMLVSLGSLAAMAVGVRELIDTLDAFAILLIRSATGAAIALALILRSGDLGVLRSQQWSLQLVRHTVHFAAQVGWIVAIAALPLATVFAIEFSSPVWGAMLAVFLLGERPTPARVFALGCGIVGMLVVLRPGISPLTLPLVAIILAAIGFGFTNVATKQLVMTDHPLGIVFWMCLIQALLALPLSLLTWMMPTLADVPWLLFVGVCGLLAHYALSKALQLADALFVLPIDFLRLPLIAIVGVLLYDERLDLWTMVGGAIIVSGVWLQLWWERRARLPEAGRAD